MKSEKTLHELLESELQAYPFNLQPQDIAKFLGVSKGTAYKLIESGEIKRLEIFGSKLILIPKTNFIEWYIDNSRNDKIK